MRQSGAIPNLQAPNDTLQRTDDDDDAGSRRRKPLRLGQHISEKPKSAVGWSVGLRLGWRGKMEGREKKNVHHDHHQENIWQCQGQEHQRKWQSHRFVLASLPSLPHQAMIKLPNCTTAATPPPLVLSSKQSEWNGGREGENTEERLLRQRQRQKQRLEEENEKMCSASRKRETH